MPEEINSINKNATLSVIVPLFNEKAVLLDLVTHLQALQAEQVIIVDGGSTDGSWQWLQKNWKGNNTKLLQSERGRAGQMNAGAKQASGQVLLFLHADTRLVDAYRAEISQALNDNKKWGRFDVRFTKLPQSGFATKMMPVIAFFINLRSRLSSITTGDQAIFVDKHSFNQVGGYAEIPLMEDIAFTKKIKRVAGRAYASHVKVEVDARRWQQQGVLRTVLLMWLLRLAYFSGVSAETLARYYRAVR